MRRWEPVDIIVAGLAIAVCTTVGSIAIAPYIELLHVMSESKAKLFVGVVSSLVSIISVYIGAMIQKKEDGKDK
jgi:LytS/YehU family sensor histidine kinase